MELKKNPHNFLDIVVKKTLIILQPQLKVPAARVVILTRLDSPEAPVFSSPEQVLIEGPGEYEVDDVTISTIASAASDEQPRSLYVNIQTLDHSVLVLPGAAAVPDKVVEQLGVVDVICLPFHSKEEGSAKAITKVLKAFPDLKKTVLVCDDTPSSQTLEELGSATHAPVNSLKLKDMTPGDADAIDIYTLVAS